MKPRHIRFERTAEILERMGVLRAMATAPRDGTPRSRPRHINTVRSKAYVVRPILLDWSSRRDHLREITQDDVVAALVGLCSLFSYAKQQGIVFRNPTSRMRVGARPYKPVQPLSPERIKQPVAAVRRPAEQQDPAEPKHRITLHTDSQHRVRSEQPSECVDHGDQRLTAGSAEELAVSSTSPDVDGSVLFLVWPL